MNRDSLYEALSPVEERATDVNIRKILVEPTSRGLFSVPRSGFTADDEVQWSKRRLDSVRVSQYSDTKCGVANLYDPTGAYLCGGRKDGGSLPCNKREGNECLIKKGTLTNPHFQSCAFWETSNAGDPEGRYCPEGKLNDDRIGFGDTNSPNGFGCVRCEYFEDMPEKDSEGRPGWCALKGHTVELYSCCWDNEPISGGDDEGEEE